MFKLYSVSIRACNRYQPTNQPTTPGRMIATLQYARIVLYIPTSIKAYVYAHTLYYIREATHILH